MARSRNIKPSFFTNDELAEIHPLGRLLFIALWTMADREGRLEDRPRRIKAEALPYDDADADALLDDLQQHGFILRYEAAGNRYIQVLAFTKHQNPHVKEAESTIPAPGISAPEPDSTIQAPDKHGASTVQDTTQTGTSPADSLLLIPDSKKNTSSARADMPAGFLRFWSEWPKSDRKVAKAECVKRWRSRGLEAQADAIVAHVKAMRDSEQWRRGYEPAPLTYLNQRRWEDGQADIPRSDWWLAKGYGDEAAARRDGWTPERAAA
jgi:hypothetical protein